MINREAIFAALFARLQANVTGIVKFTRRFLDPNQLQPEEMPALILVADSYVPMEPSAALPGVPYHWTLNATVILYARALAENESPEEQLNVLIDLVEAAVTRQATESSPRPSHLYSTTLGGLVLRVNISGQVELIPGEGGSQAAAIIPLEIVAA